MTEGEDSMFCGNTQNTERRLNIIIETPHGTIQQTQKYIFVATWIDMFIQKLNAHFFF